MSKKKIVLRCEVVYDDATTNPQESAELIESFINNSAEYQDYGCKQVEVKKVYYPYKKEITK